MAPEQTSRNVVCLKWGTLYGPEYVNILHSMATRHLSSPFRFICFTDDVSGLNPDIETFPLPVFPEPDWKYARYCSAWRKLSLFETGLADIKGRVLFLDLDVVVLSSLDAFFEREAEFSMIENWYQPGRGQASVMCFDRGSAAHLLNEYLADPETILQQYRTEQDFISDKLSSESLFFPHEWCKSFKKHVMPNVLGRLTGNRYRDYSEVSEAERPKILVFHGRPNPPDAILGEWGKPLPGFKRWIKGLRPCPWIADYWCE